MKNLILSFITGIFFISNLSAQNDTLYFRTDAPGPSHIYPPASQTFPGPLLSGLSQYKMEFEDSVKFMWTSVELYDTNENYIMDIPVWLDTLPSVFNPPVKSASATMSTMLNSRMKVVPKLMDSLDIHLFIKVSFYYSADSVNIDTLSSYFWIDKNLPWGPSFASLNDNNKPSFSAYPSPFSKKIIIDGLETDENEIQFELYSLDGKLVEKGLLNIEKEVILEKQHKGVHILHLKTKAKHLGRVRVLGKE